MNDDADDGVSLESAAQKLGASGGRARAASLSKEQLAEQARVAARGRWGLPRATHEGTLTIGDLRFPCSVLADASKTRVLSETEFMKGIGMYRSGALATRRKETDEPGAQTPLFLAQKNLKPFISRHFGPEHKATIKYLTRKGAVAHGITAATIPKICELWMDARAEGQLGETQKKIAAKAELLLRALAHVGIIALVDEATGYQAERARNALAEILQRFIAKELQPYTKTFPDEFYKEIWRLRGWQSYDDALNRRPGCVAHMTVDLAYQRLAPGVLDELKRLTPRDDNGRLKAKLFQHLTDHTGVKKLKEHLGKVVVLMQASVTWDQFKDLLDRALPRYGETLLLPFAPEDRQ